MSTPENRLRSIDLDRCSKKDLIALAKALGLPHGGLKAAVEARLRAHRATLLPSSAPTTTVPATTITLASSAATMTVSAPSLATTTAPTVLATGAHGLRTSVVAPAPPVPPLLPPGLGVPTSALGLVPPLLPGAPGPYPPLPPAASAPGLANNAPGGPATGWPPTNLQAIAQQAAQQAVAQALSQLQAPPGPLPCAYQPPAAPTHQPPAAPMYQPPAVPMYQPPAAPMYQPPAAPTYQLPAAPTYQPPAAALQQPPLATLYQPAGAPPYQAPAVGTHQNPTTTAYPLYQPPTASRQEIQTLQAALHPTPTQPLPVAPNIHLAPQGSYLPTIPPKFVAAAAAGEFVDFSELLHALQVDSGEEPALFIQVGEGQQLSLPRKPKKKAINTLGDWVRCFAVYASTLVCYQPTRGPDMMAYLHLIASTHQEFSFSACMAYDVAFRKKAAQLRLTSWGHVDPQLYSRAFTGAGKAKPGVLCSICLDVSHPTADCPLYSGGPAKRPKLAAGPKRSNLYSLADGREICLNYNRGKCSRPDCPRAHRCTTRGCQGQHMASQCTLRRRSPRKP